MPVHAPTDVSRMACFLQARTASHADADQRFLSWLLQVGWRYWSKHIASLRVVGNHRIEDKAQWGLTSRAVSTKPGPGATGLSRALPAVTQLPLRRQCKRAGLRCHMSPKQ